MPDTQLQDLDRKLDTIINNQQIINQNLVAIERRLTERLDKTESNTQRNRDHDLLAAQQLEQMIKEVGRLRDQLNK